MATPKEHISEIRRVKFSIGKKLNPLTEDLHQAVKIFSAELYSKDVHFLMELIQNAEDNDYPEGSDPSLQFIVTSRDITGTGASSTLLIFNNEKGFTRKNIDSICSVGRSTKKGNRKRGYIGEKGIGFKSVFLITTTPYIFSNGYRIRFNEEPCSECNVGYIVPQWVEDSSPILSNIKLVYGSGTTLPTTTMVLPLKPEKIDPVKKQLSSIHPEILLFLSKIKQLSVKEDNENPKAITVNAVAISTEINFESRKNIDAESYSLHLSTGEDANNFDSECTYYMWRQRFPVTQENAVERRIEVEEWSITLAFPFKERLQRGNASPTVYAYLPTEMITNFPFVIHADFLLASSRENIMFDSKWNNGILGCVPSAFINAFKSLVVGTESAPVFNLPNMFRFLPINPSSYSQLNTVRDTIRSMLIMEDIIPCETYTNQKFFHKPSEVGRLMPSFWNILNEAREQGIQLHNLSSHGSFILNSSFDTSKFNDVLNYLEIKFVDSEWYAKCIRSSNLVLGLSVGAYSELLFFLAVNWSSKFKNTSIMTIPLIKYVDLNLKVSLCTINESARGGGTSLFLSSHSSTISWLIDWAREFKCISSLFPLPKATQESISSFSQSQKLLNWLTSDVKVTSYGIFGYASHIINSVNADNRKLAITYLHFLYHSFTNMYLTEVEISSLCNKIPIIDVNGNATTRRNGVGVLVPGNGSKWAKLFDFNPWGSSYVEIGENYLQPGNFAGVYTTRNVLLNFLIKFVGASDIPNLPFPDAVIPSFSSHLTQENVLLLLDWLYNRRRYGIPERFLSSIKNGCWLKVFLSKSPAYKPPSQSFLCSSEWGNLLQDGSVLVDIPLIDEGFYNNQIRQYKEELLRIGVRFEFAEACKYIGDQLMKKASFSALSKSSVFSILNFIRFLRSKMVPINDFINSIKHERWLKTSSGLKSCDASVLFDLEWTGVAKISDMPFIDQHYYGKKISSYKDELKLLGVVVAFNNNYKLVIDNLKSTACKDACNADVLFVMLQCISHYPEPSNKVEGVLKKNKCLKTNVGFKFPGECYLFDPNWGSLLQVFNGHFPLIDDDFYGNHIISFKNQLKIIGVVVEFQDASLQFASYFKKQASFYSITRDHVFSFLAIYRHLKAKRLEFPINLIKCIKEAPWLRTRLGQYMCPKDCILFGSDWQFISPLSVLPFIDDSDNYYGIDIHKYRVELKNFGVTLDLKHGIDFVARSLSFPHDPTSIAPTSVLSLMECIKILQVRWVGSAPNDFLAKVSKPWLKTHFGYLTPKNALLFSEKWRKFLQITDGPFINEEFYAPSLSSYSQELCSIGVIIDVENGCPLLANSLKAHSKFSTIVRIYSYLSEFNWKPEKESRLEIWIPYGSDDGQWVIPETCVLHDKDVLFSSYLTVLDTIYPKRLLGFLSGVMKVPHSPSFDHYLRLWKDWESNTRLSEKNCGAFWAYVANSWEQWSSKKRKSFALELVKLPTDSRSSGMIWLGNKNDVFLGDDLQLKDLFARSSPNPIFVWYPEANLPSPSRSKLLDIYNDIGVHTISEAVQVEEDESLSDNVELDQSLFKKELFVLILGFLAGPRVRMEAKRRHEILKRILDISVYKTIEPISVGYKLPLSSGEVIRVKQSSLFRWDREKSKLFTQKVDAMGGGKSSIEFATSFSKVISEGLLWDEEELISDLSELIKLAFLVEFDEEAVGFLMKNKNLQIYEEDEIQVKKKRRMKYDRKKRTKSSSALPYLRSR